MSVLHPVMDLVADRADHLIASALRDVVPRAGFEASLLVLLAAGPHLYPTEGGRRHHWLVAGSVAGAIGAGAACWGIVRRTRRRVA